MNRTFQIKFAWICNHEEYGEIISFFVFPKVVLSSFGVIKTYGYVMDDDKLEVVRFPAGHPQAQSIIRRLSRLNPTQWSEPSFDYVEEEFDLDDFFVENIYQDNYGRIVKFHTNNECLF